MSRCEIHLNTVGGMGGGIAVDVGATPTIHDCYVHDNTSSTGGGICSTAAGGLISDCRLVGNTATFGGGLALVSAMDVLISDTLVEGNESVHSGGGVYASDSSFEILRCEIDDNHTQGAGGAMWLLNTDALVAETTILANSAVGATGGIRIDTSSLTVSSCEVSDNGIGLEVLGLSRALADARHNWWGDDSGPQHPTLNPLGLGDVVSDGVQFVPWNSATGVSESVQHVHTSWGAIKASHSHTAPLRRP